MHLRCGKVRFTAREDVLYGTGVAPYGAGKIHFPCNYPASDSEASPVSEANTLPRTQ